MAVAPSATAHSFNRESKKSFGGGGGDGDGGGDGGGGDGDGGGGLGDGGEGLGDGGGSGGGGEGGGAGQYPQLPWQSVLKGAALHLSILSSDVCNLSAQNAGFVSPHGGEGGGGDGDGGGGLGNGGEGLGGSGDGDGGDGGGGDGEGGGGDGDGGEGDGGGGGGDWQHASLQLLESFCPFFFLLQNLVHFFSDFSHTFVNFFLSLFLHTSLKLLSASQFFGDGLEARRRTPSPVAPTASTLAARTSTEILRSMVGFIAWRTVYLRTGRRWHIGAGAGVPDTASDSGETGG